MTEAIERIYWRMMRLIGCGRIKHVNDADTVQQVQVRLGPDEVRDNTLRMAEWGFVSNPPPGSHAVVLFAGGDRSDGVVVATGHRLYRMKDLGEGEVAIHDDLGQSVYLTRAGIVINGAGLPVTITNTPKVRMETPLLEVTGDIKDQCDASGRTMAGMRAIYNGHGHPDPQGGTVGAPNQEM